jgi:uncharacterized PurR-regulated membrane protein YhhQ (DUF165 family)
MQVLIFLAAIVLANLSVAHFGPVSTPINAFFLIGLNLTLRDSIHDRWHNKNLTIKMLALVVASAGITYALNKNAGIIGLASVIAFTASLSADWILYQAFWNKKKWQKMLYSNTGSAAVDSVLFPTIAFGAIMPEIIILQFLAKFFGSSFWIWVINSNFIAKTRNIKL